MKRALAMVAFLAGCGNSPQPTAVHMTMDSSSGLSASQVGSVEILVIGGPRATCMRAMQPASPLDDPELEILMHALFTLDGSAKHLSGVPADRPLVFYAEAFQGKNGERPRIGRGCSEGQLAAGSSSGISIVITASD
ncbi:MAG TPA: hypothetical protein VFF06_27595 [Polyangia bacterium]|nr:hypothetical protein [Polyangia bacterium]